MPCNFRLNIRPEDWRSVDSLIDWIIDKNRAGYQMVNSVQRLQEMKAFVRVSSGVDPKQYGWYGDGTSANGNIAAMLGHTPGIAHDPSGELHFSDWNCRAGQNNVIIRTDGTVAPCFPMYPSTFDWGKHRQKVVNQGGATRRLKTGQHRAELLEVGLGIARLRRNRNATHSSTGCSGRFTCGVGTLPWIG